MNPSLVRDLDREGAAILQLIDGMPRGRDHDVTGHLDAKKAIQERLAALMKRWREAGAGTTAERPKDLSGGVVKIARPRARMVEGHGSR